VDVGDYRPDGLDLHTGIDKEERRFVGPAYDDSGSCRMRSVRFLDEGVEVFDDSFALQQREVAIHNSGPALAEAVDLSVSDLRLGPELCEFLFGVNGRQFADLRLVARRCGDVPVSKSLGEIVVGGLSVDYFGVRRGRFHLLPRLAWNPS
jgi:hypothetical protein